MVSLNTIFARTLLNQDMLRIAAIIREELKAEKLMITIETVEKHFLEN